MRAPAERPLVVCDTDVASFVIKEDPIRAPRYLPHLEGHEVVIPFCVVAELRLGAMIRRWGGPRQSRLAEFLREGRVCFPDDRLCTLWASVTSRLRRPGRPIGHHDGWVATIALYFDAPLVTHNAGHYRYVPGLTVLTEAD